MSNPLKRFDLFQIGFDQKLFYITQIAYEWTIDRSIIQNAEQCFFLLQQQNVRADQIAITCNIKNVYLILKMMHNSLVKMALETE